MLKVQSTFRRVVKEFNSLPSTWGRAQQHIKKNLRAVWHSWARHVVRLPKIPVLTFVS